MTQANICHPREIARKRVCFIFKDIQIFHHLHNNSSSTVVNHLEIMSIIHIYTSVKQQILFVNLDRNIYWTKFENYVYQTLRGQKIYLPNTVVLHILI